MTNRRGHRRQSKAPVSNVKVAVPPRNDPQMPAEDYTRMHHRYYIVRPEPNKTCVPLIAVDELPPGFHLKGVPLTITPQQIQEWDMARVGADVKLEYSFQVNFEPPISSQRAQQPDYNTKSTTLSKATAIVDGISTDITATDEEVGSNKSAIHDKPESVQVNTKENQRPTSELQQQANEAAKEFVEQSKWERENDRSKTQDAATPGIYGKKKFCTHWIRTGNCDYMQEGCRYLHVIPDAETRLSIGIRDMPRWAKEDLPSPPREVHRGRRHSLTPPKDSRKDTQKDWRQRGNRKANAEPPAGPPMARAAPVKSLTPTPQSSKQGSQHGPQRGSLQTQTVPTLESTHANRSHYQAAGSSPAQQHAPPKFIPAIDPAIIQSTTAAPTHADSSHYEKTSSSRIEPDAQPKYISTIGPQVSQSTTAAPIQRSAPQAGQQAPVTQGPTIRPQQFTPLLFNSSPLPMRSASQSGFYGAASRQKNTSFGYDSLTPDGNYGVFRSPLQSTEVPPLDPRIAHFGGSRWVQPPYHPQSPMSQNFGQSRPNPAPAPSTPVPWFQNLLHSPNPSHSDASIGTIGHGWPSGSNQGVMSPIPGPPIMHRRLFRQPGESQYIEAQPEPKAPRSGDSHRTRSHRGRGSTGLNQTGNNGGSPGQMGNLIALDE